MFVHIERYASGNSADGTYASVGLAKSTDAGKTWRFLGEIFGQNLSYADYVANPGRCGTDTDTKRFGVVNTGFGQYVIRNEGGTDYFYIYGPDTQTPALGSTGPCTTNFAVARAPVASVIAAAKNNAVTPWRKYYAGGWTEPALGGRSTDLRPGQRRISFDVAYDSYLRQYILVAPNPLPNGEFELDLQTSADGVNWSVPHAAFTETGEIYAPTIAGLGKNPDQPGQSFNVIYGNSPEASSTSSRRLDGFVASRQVTLG
jgi:hypothetical protein